MATFPTYAGDENRPRETVTVTPPAFDDNSDNSKTREEWLVEQQWRDVARLKIEKEHPLSINRDENEVTSDGYAV